MRRNDWEVKPDGREDGHIRCFYCGADVGAQHRSGCAHRTRTVVCAVTFTYVRKVHEDADRDLIEFSMNESSSCADNLLAEIGSLKRGDRCLCGVSEGAYVREATEDDLREMNDPDEPVTASLALTP